MSAAKLSTLFQINPDNIVIIYSIPNWSFLLHRAKKRTKISIQIPREILAVRLRPEKLPWLT